MDNNDSIPISALQHYLYCPRQCALIHIERLWMENRHTAEGRILHGRVDQPKIEQRQRVRTITSMPIFAPELGISGVADVIEFHAGDEGNIPYPVEYKRGRPKPHQADQVQLCAQALCLESMYGCSVPEGALYYGKTRRRLVVSFDCELRRLTHDAVAATREMICSGKTPLATYEAKRCDACSLINLCWPWMLNRAGKVQQWLEKQIRIED